MSGRSDIGLSDCGRAEAARTGERLTDVQLAAVYSSPRRRARETAEIIALRQDLEVTLTDALDEIDFGSWSGQSFSALDTQPDWKHWNSARGTAATPAGETMAAVTRRAVTHIEHLQEEGPVLCVSHCDVIRGIVAHYLGLHGDRLLSFDCDPASLTTLALYGGGGRVVALNERPS